MNLAILLPTLGIGGGVSVVLKHADLLQKKGYRVTLITESPPCQDALAWLETFGGITTVSIHDTAERMFDLCIATAWQTVYALPKICAKQYAYFVQDIESWFLANDDMSRRTLADATYLCPLPIITVSNYLKKILEQHFGRTVLHVNSGINKHVFNEDGPYVTPPRRQGIRVLVEGSLMIQHKNVPRTLELVRLSKPDEVWLVSSSDIAWYPGVDRVFRNLAPQEMAKVYRSCDILVKLSTVEGFGLPPLEMFHCGGTVIANRVMGRLDFMKDGENSLLVDVGDDRAVVAALQTLKDNPDLLQHLKIGARATSHTWPDEHKAATDFENAIQEIIALPPVTLTALNAPLDPYRDLIFRTAKPPSFQKKITQTIRTFPKYLPWLKRRILPYYAHLVLAKQIHRGQREYTFTVDQFTAEESQHEV